MDRSEKAAVVEDLRERFSGAAAVYLTEYRGSTVEEMMGLRRKLAEAGATYRVVKNTLARRAAEGTGAACLAEDFTGPIAVAIAEADPVAPAKVLKEVTAELKNLTLRCGMVEARRVEVEEIHQLAEMPSREELLAKLLSLLNAPAQQLLSLMNAPASQVVRLIDAAAKAKA